jgi:hypothetical protein
MFYCKGGLMMEQLLNNAYFQAFMILLIVTIITIFAKVFYPKIKAYLDANGIDFTEEDKIMLEQILEATNYVAEKLGYDITDELKEVTKYVYDAIAFVKEANKVDDLEILTELVLEKTQEIMKEKGIIVDEALKEIITTVIEFAIKKIEK